MTESTVKYLPRRPSRVVLKSEDAQAWFESYDILLGAKAEAQAILTQAEEEIAKAREKGRNEGANLACRMLVEAGMKVDRYMAGLEADITDLVMHLVRQVLDEYDEAERLERMVRKALNSFRNEQIVTLSVPSAEADTIERVLADVAHPALRVEADDCLSAGQATLSSPVAVMDISLDIQLKEIQKALSAGIGNAGSGQSD